MGVAGKLDRFSRSKPWILLASMGLALTVGTALLISADADQGQVEFIPVSPDSGIGGGTGDQPVSTQNGSNGSNGINPIPGSNGFNNPPRAFTPNVSAGVPNSIPGSSGGSSNYPSNEVGSNGGQTPGSDDPTVTGFLSINDSRSGRFNVSINTDNMAPGDVREGKINLKNTSKSPVVVSMSKSSLTDFGVSLKDSNNVEFTSKVLPAGDNEVVTLSVSLPVDMSTKAENQVLTISFHAESNSEVK